MAQAILAQALRCRPLAGTSSFGLCQPWSPGVHPVWKPTHCELAGRGILAPMLLMPMACAKVALWSPLALFRLKDVAMLQARQRLHPVHLRVRLRRPNVHHWLLGQRHRHVHCGGISLVGAQVGGSGGRVLQNLLPHSVSLLRTAAFWVGTSSECCAPSVMSLAVHLYGQWQWKPCNIRWNPHEIIWKPNETIWNLYKFIWKSCNML